MKQDGLFDKPMAPEVCALSRMPNSACERELHKYLTENAQISIGEAWRTAWVAAIRAAEMTNAVALCRDTQQRNLERLRRGDD